MPRSFTLLLAAFAMGCGPSPQPTQPPAAAPTTDDGVTHVDSTAPADDTPPPPRSATCGTAGLTVLNYDWVPADARVAVTIALAEPDTPAALAALAAHGESDSHGLPIAFAFGVTQWPIVVPVLGTLLDAIGLQPEELVYVAPATGPAFAWVVRSDCDLDEAIARIEEAWGLTPRRRVEGVVVSTPPDPNAGDGTLRHPTKRGETTAQTTDRASAPQLAAFPYDVVFASGGRVALVPRGYGEAFLTILATTSGRSASRPRPSWTQRLQGIKPAPVRGILSGHALLGTNAKHAPGTMALRALHDAVTVDPLDDDATDPQ